METKGVVNLDAVRAYQQRHGAKQTEECLKRLGILQTFYNAQATPVGKELLACVSSELIRLSERILTDPAATDDDKSMFRAYSHIGQVWTKKIGDYENLLRSLAEPGN